jgi:hypothetical protein
MKFLANLFYYFRKSAKVLRMVRRGRGTVQKFPFNSRSNHEI